MTKRVVTISVQPIVELYRLCGMVKPAAPETAGAKPETPVRAKRAATTEREKELVSEAAQ